MPDIECELPDNMELESYVPATLQMGVKIVPCNSAMRSDTENNGFDASGLDN